MEVVFIIEKGNTYNRIVCTAGKSALELCDTHMIRENATFVNAGLVFQSLDSEWYLLPLILSATQSSKSFRT
jgi:hypothetical protein